jgi:hypothetical protein
MSQIRNGGVEFFNQASVVLSTLVPAAGIVNTGFAFHDYKEVWQAMDGPLGAYVRAQIEKVGLLTMSKPWDNGFRQITTSTKPIKTAGDLKGLKLRVPAAPMLTSLFTALGASPTPINFNEVYSSLQTKLVEGQETRWPSSAPRACTKCRSTAPSPTTSGMPTGSWATAVPSRSCPRTSRKSCAANWTRPPPTSAPTSPAGRLRCNDLQGKGVQIIEADKESFKAALAQANSTRHARRLAMRPGSCCRTRREPGMSALSLEQRRPMSARWPRAWKTGWAWPSRFRRGPGGGRGRGAAGGRDHALHLQQPHPLGR